MPIYIRTFWFKNVLKMFSLNKCGFLSIISITYLCLLFVNSNIFLNSKFQMTITKDELLILTPRHSCLINPLRKIPMVLMLQYERLRCIKLSDQKPHYLPAIRIRQSQGTKDIVRHSNFYVFLLVITQ